MARGDKVPEGVMYHNPTGEARSTKGSRHPDGIGSGREMPAKISGSKPERNEPAAASTGKRPSGVRSESGTENKKAKEKVKTSVPTSRNQSGDESKRPSGVRSHGGLSAPKSVR